MSTKNVITDLIPADWHDLQVQVGRILEECGFVIEIDKSISTVRGSVNVDVYAEDRTQKPTTIYICECKDWSSSVPKTSVHSLRTVISDFGANWGLLISSGGFQRGAFEAAEKSNIKLLGWLEFQELFVDRWVDKYMLSRINEEIDPLVEYTEPINSRIFRKADALSPELRKEFVKLRNQYRVLATFALMYSFPEHMHRELPALPLKTSVKSENMNFEEGLPYDVLEATSLRQYLDVICKHAQTGVAAFDKVFGERA